MKQLLIIIVICLASWGCATAQNSNSSTTTPKIPNSSSSIVTQYNRLKVLMNFNVPHGSTPSLRGGLPDKGALFFDTLDYHYYKFDSLRSNGTEAWSQQPNNADVEDFMSLGSNQTISGSNTFAADQLFQGKVGIGNTPVYSLDVQPSGAGRMYFNGTRLGLSSDATSKNLLIGDNNTGSVAIGADIGSDTTDWVRIGNTHTTRLHINKLLMDVSATPSVGDVPTWDGTKYTPSPGSGTPPVFSVFGRTGNIAAQAGDYSAFYPSFTGYNRINWDTAYDKHIVSAAFSGTDTKTLTLTARDGSTVTANFADNTGTTGSGLTSLNGDESTTQGFATGTSGTDFNISTASGIHTFNIPTASAAARGLLSTALYNEFHNKQNAIATGTTAQYLRGDGSLATFPTNLSSFTNGPGYLTTTTADTRYPQLSSSIADPSFVASLSWSKIISRPTTLGGYGITNAVPNSRTVNSKPLSANVTLTYADLGVNDYAHGGTNASTAADAINGMLPPQTGHSGQVLKTDGTGVLSWTASAGGVSQAALDDTAAAIRADFPDCSPPNFTSLPDVAEGSGSYTQTVTVTASTVPSGTVNHTYYWTLAGHEVFMQLNLKWATAGSGVTRVVVPLPTGAPAPILPAGFNAVNNIITYGDGGLATAVTARVANNPAVYLQVSASGNSYQLVIESAAISASAGYINIHYHTGDQQ